MILEDFWTSFGALFDKKGDRKKKKKHCLYFHSFHICHMDDSILQLLKGMAWKRPMEFGLNTRLSSPGVGWGWGGVGGLGGVELGGEEWEDFSFVYMSFFPLFSSQTYHFINQYRCYTMIQKALDMQNRFFIVPAYGQIDFDELLTFYLKKSWKYI